MKAKGGKSLYGARVGILMLEARFPRVPGDVGNGETWPFPVLYRVVRGASPQRVVRERARGLLDDFLAAAAELVDLGADGLTTTCGFLSLYQRELAAQSRVPVATSSLMQVPLIQATLPPGKRVGVVTVDSKSLTAEHLTLAGAPADTPVQGTEEGREFTRVLLDNESELDLDLATADLVDAGESLCRRHPDVGAIVFECANMAPYSRRVAEATGRPVYDAVNFITWFHGGLRPRTFPPP